MSGELTASKYCYRIKYSAFIPRKEDRGIYFVFHRKRTKQEQRAVSRVFSLSQNSFYDHESSQEVQKIQVWDYDNVSCIYTKKFNKNQRIVKDIVPSQNLQIQIIFTIEKCRIKTKESHEFKKKKENIYQADSMNSIQTIFERNQAKTLLSNRNYAPQNFKSGPIKFRYQQPFQKNYQHRIKARSQIFQVYSRNQ